MVPTQLAIGRTTPQHIKTFTERLRGVVIENRSYERVLRTHDYKDTLHFLDPPYVKSTRDRRHRDSAYFQEMTDEQHREMAGVARELKGMVIIAGYDSELYAELFSDWRVVKKETFADGAAKRVECLWMNDRCVQSQMQLFDHQITVK